MPEETKEKVFTPEQVKCLNLYQKEGRMHPFTCGSGNRTDEHHLDGEGVLVATEEGWKCPYCPYVQDWAHNWMLTWKSGQLPTVQNAVDVFGNTRGDNDAG
jgi:hypothetical protein